MTQWDNLENDFPAQRIMARKVPSADPGRTVHSPRTACTAAIAVRDNQPTSWPAAKYKSFVQGVRDF